MKVFFMIVVTITISLLLRDGCQRDFTDINKDCKIVCGESGYDHDYAVKTGMFSYRCQCKHFPKKRVPVPPRH